MVDFGTAGSLLLDLIFFFFLASTNRRQWSAKMCAEPVVCIVNGLRGYGMVWFDTREMNAQSVLPYVY